MRHLPLSDGPWTHPAYERRVRGTVYLWGSAGLTKNLTFDRPLHLHILNDLHGEPVTLGTSVAAGAKTSLGVLGPGECVTVSLQGIAGVFATSTAESTVKCLIHP